MIGNTNSKLLI